MKSKPTKTKSQTSQEKQKAALEHLAVVLDLDQEGVEQRKSLPSGFGSNTGGAVHALELIELKDKQYWLKEEEVYCDSRRTFEYQSFPRFLESLFWKGDSMVASRCFDFENEPNLSKVCYSSSLMSQHRKRIATIDLDTDPESILEEDLKSLFLLYLSKRAEILEEGGVLKEKVYGHNGREVINEVLASALGNLLDIPVAENYFAQKKKHYYYPYQKNQLCKQGIVRFVASENLCFSSATKQPHPNCLNLEDLCLQISSLKKYEQVAGAFDLNWHFANPLGLEALSSVEPITKNKVKVVQETLQHPRDLAASDFLDHLLGGEKDRKLQEYILPSGKNGRVYTVDFGEILFPEIQFEVDCESYQKAKKKHLESFQRYLEQLQQVELPAFYQLEVRRVLTLFQDLPSSFFSDLFSQIPAFYFQSHWDDPKPCYQLESLLDLFQGLQETLQQSEVLDQLMEDSPRYQIPEGKKLLILDAHDTIFKRDFSREVSRLFLNPEEKDRIEWVLREGIVNFLSYFHDLKGLKIVISSDGGKQRLTEISKKFGIFQSLERIYGSNHMDKQTYLKKLDVILTEMNIPAEQALFIGDGRIDQLSCAKHNVDFIKVPNTVQGRSFSFNRFIHLDFNQGHYGLELQKLEGLQSVHHNLSTAELVEHALAKGEARLAHLGPLVVNYNLQPEDPIAKYIVKEPSTENEIDWAGDYKPYEIDQFEALYQRFTESLQDQEIYLVDCYSGASHSQRIPFRILTEKAWQGLFVRNMFHQLPEEEMPDFFPEYTLIFSPGFQEPVEEGQGQGQGESSGFMMINAVQKIILIAGTMNPETIREAVFAVLSLSLPLDDVIPIRCSANIGETGDVSLFFGAPPSYISLDQRRFFFGDDCHGWGRDFLWNMEWGCLMKMQGQDSKTNPFPAQVISRFGTLLLQTKMHDNRRLDLDADRGVGSGVECARASFPIAHFPHADRTGVAGLPQHIFLFIEDQRGIFPPLAKLSYAEAVLHLLIGYGSDNGSDKKGFTSLLGSRPFTFSPPRYASLLFERLQSSKATCYLVNVTPNPSAPLALQKQYPLLLTNFVREIQQGRITEDCFTEMPLLGLAGLTHFETEEGIQAKDLWPTSNVKNKDRNQIVKEISHRLEAQSDRLIPALKKRIQQWMDALESYLQ